MLRHFLVLTLVAILPVLGHGDDLNDICKESPDLCTGTLAPQKAAPAPAPAAATKRDLSTNQVMSTNTKTVKRAAAAKKDGRKRLDELSTTQDNWDDLQNESQIYEKPAPPPRRSAGPPPPMRKPATAAAANRGPASLPSGHAAPATAMIPPPAKTPPPRPKNLTFESYMMENAVNPAMTLKIQDHQKAFADLSKPAVITIPGAEPDTVAAPTNTTSAVNGTVVPPGGQNPLLPSVGAPSTDGTAGGAGTSYTPPGGSSNSGAGLPIR